MAITTSATRSGQLDATGADICSAPHCWSQAHTPIAATQATTTKAGKAGVRYVCTGISATLCTGATAQAAAVQINLRDGASGAGTILWSETLILPANSFAKFAPPNLSILGSLGAAMTLEWSAAGAAGTFESVSLSGYQLEDA